MARKLVRHGTNNGYRAELAMGDACSKCKAAHRVFQTQYSRTARQKGIKYRGDQVLDQLDGSVQVIGSSKPPYPANRTQPHSAPSFGDFTVGTEPSDTGQQGPVQGRAGASLSDRIRSLVTSEPENEYVSDSEIPDYLTPDSVDPDPDPDDAEYSAVADDSAEYIINAAGIAKIEDSLGTYLAVVGITIEMIDPYCGPILAENMDNIVRRWAKVIGKYPKAAELFMDGKGGTLMAWITAIQATWPFLFAIYEHHFSKDVQTSGGQIFRKMPNGTRTDPTAPPMPDNFTYTAG